MKKNISKVIVLLVINIILVSFFLNLAFISDFQLYSSILSFMFIPIIGIISVITSVILIICIHKSNNIKDLACLVPILMVLIVILGMPLGRTFSDNMIENKYKLIEDEQSAAIGGLEHFEIEYYGISSSDTEELKNKYYIPLKTTVGAYKKEFEGYKVDAYTETIDSNEITLTDDTEIWVYVTSYISDGVDSYRFIYDTLAIKNEQLIIATHVELIEAHPGSAADNDKIIVSIIPCEQEIIGG